jgi:hypothetical protein
VIRAGGTKPEAATAAGVNVSTIKRWLDQPAFQAMVRGSPDIRAGAPPTVGPPGNAGAFEQDERLRMWVASGAGRKGPPKASVTYARVSRPSASRSSALTSSLNQIGRDGR